MGQTDDADSSALTTTDVPAEAPAAPAASAIEEAGLPAVTTRALLLGSGPRFARDAFGPVLAFYLVWKVAGLVPAIAASTVVSVLAWRHERGRGRPGVLARVSLGIVVLQAVIGLAADDARVFLAQPVLVNAAYGLVFAGSAVLGRPLAGVFAGEMYPFPPEVRASATFRRVFGRVSLAWGAYLLVRSALRLLTLTMLSVDAFVGINLVTGVPLTVALMSWSVWYAGRGFRRSEEWGWAFAPA